MNRLQSIITIVATVAAAILVADGAFAGSVGAAVSQGANEGFDLVQSAKDNIVVLATLAGLIVVAVDYFTGKRIGGALGAVAVIAGFFMFGAGFDYVLGQRRVTGAQIQPAALEQVIDHKVEAAQ